MASNSTTSAGKGPEEYLSTSEDGRTPASIIATGAVFSILPAIAVFLRFYCHLRVTRSKLAVDDWLMLGAFILTLGLGIMLIVGGALHGLAEPTPEGWAKTDYLWVTDDAEIITEKIFWAFNLVQDISFGLAKLSVLAFYRRIFSTPLFNALNTALMVIVSIWSIGFFFAYVFRCGTTFWALWAPLEDLMKYCYTSTPMFYALGISDVITDVLILSLPFFWIWKLRMTLGKKLAVSGVFLLGAIEIATGIARLAVYLKQAANPYQNADGIGHLTTMMFWSMIEMGIAVVAGCLPTIWPLISKVSVENMVRSVRSVLSLESLRDALGGRGSTSKSRSAGVGSGKMDGSSEHVGPYVQFPESTHGGTPQHSREQSSDGYIGVDRSVEVKRSPAADDPEPESVRMQDLSVRTVTQVSSAGHSKHHDSNV